MARRFLAHRAAMEEQVETVAAEYLGMGKTKLYELTREDEHDVILVPWIFDYYTKLGFSPAHNIHKIHALRSVSASSALSSFFCYRGLARPFRMV